MADIPITIALDTYDRHVPFFIGTVRPPEGTVLVPVNAVMSGRGRDGSNRHARMFHDKEFDVAEVSLASYIVGKCRNRDFGFIATPVFPRRLFSQNQMFVNVDAGIRSPKDLEGKRVGLQSFQTTLSVLANGDLAFEYGVDWTKLRYVTRRAEEFPVPIRPGVETRFVDGGPNFGDWLVDGKIDALFQPHPPRVVHDRTDRVRRLFAEPQAECKRYWRKSGYYPIMHLMALTDNIVDRLPGLALGIMATWEQAKNQAEHYNEDPAFCQAAFAHQALEEQRRGMAEDLWPSGLAANRANLERFIFYLHEMGLIDHTPTVESLFHESTWDT